MSASYVRVTTIRCNCCQVEGTMRGTATKLRSILAASGWTRGGFDEDYCPKCSKPPKKRKK